MEWIQAKGTGIIVLDLIIVLLIFFIPSHVYFIKIGSCVPNGLCVNPIIGWLRLVIVHPILILWAWYVGKLNLRLAL